MMTARSLNETNISAPPGPLSSPGGAFLFPLPPLNSPKAARHLSRVMGKYADPERFGVIARDTGVPVHVNSTDNPLPIYVNGARRPMSCGPTKMAGHMEATKENRQAMFLINRPDAQTYLIPADLDCKRTGDPLRCLALGNTINSEILQDRGWSERSRNIQGRYVWMMVQRAPGETAERFTEQLNRFNRFLRTRYPHHSTNDGVGFDAVKGSPWFTTDNPAVTEDRTLLTELLLADTHNIVPCPDWVADKGPDAEYEWHRQHYRKGEFQRIECLEPKVLHFGVLVTRPLHGVRLDPSGEERWQSFFKWEADPANIIPSSELWALIPTEFEAEKSTRKVVAERPEKPCSPRSENQTSKISTNQKPGKPLAMLMTDDKLISMNGGASLAVTAGKGVATVEDVLVHYRQGGAATDGDTPQRIARAAESLEYFTSTYDPAKLGSTAPFFDAITDVSKDALPVIRSRFTKSRLRDFNKAQVTTNEEGKYWNKPRTSLTQKLVAQGWLVCSKIIWAENGGLAVAKIQGMFRVIYGRKLSGQDAKALLTILSRLQLIMVLDPTYRFFTPGPATDDQSYPCRCRIWGFAPGGLLPHFIKNWVPHTTSQRGRARFAAAGFEAQDPEVQDQQQQDQLGQDQDDTIESGTVRMALPEVQVDDVRSLRPSPSHPQIGTSYLTQSAVGPGWEADDDGFEGEIVAQLGRNAEMTRFLAA